VRIVFITSTSYSGSTLLSLLLNTHPRILSIGEMGPTVKSESADYLCSCGTPLVECPFFVEVGARMARNGTAHDPLHWDLRHRYSDHPFWNRLTLATPYRPILLGLRDSMRDLVPAWRKRFQDYCRRNGAFIGAALEAAGKDVFLDATKHPSRIPLLARLTRELKVIHLLRDPRGYCYSVRKHRPDSLEVPAQDWVRGNRLAEFYGRRLGRDAWMRLRYESLCRDPARTLRALTEFIGVEPCELPQNFREFPHHVVGNAMRLPSDGRVRIQLDERWRESLSEQDHAVTSELAGELARTYGYRI
jgi:hypothetical protein